MTICPNHIDLDTWLSSCWDDIASMSLAAGVTIQQNRDAAVEYERLIALLGPATAEVIPFPARAVR